MMLNN